MLKNTPSPRAAPCVDFDEYAGTRSSTRILDPAGKTPRWSQFHREMPIHVELIEMLEIRSLCPCLNRPRKPRRSSWPILQRQWPSRPRSRHSVKEFSRPVLRETQIDRAGGCDHDRDRLRRRCGRAVGRPGRAAAWGQAFPARRFAGRDVSRSARSRSTGRRA